VWAVGATNMPVQQKVVDPVRLMPAPSMKMAWAWAMTLPVHVRVFLAMRADAAEPCFVPVPSPVRAFSHRKPSSGSARQASAKAQNDPFELVDSPWGHIEAWRASTLATGTMGALHQVYDIVRNDAAAAVARVEETENRKELVQRLCDMVAALQDRINTLADALEARHRAHEEEAQRQREFEEEPLTLPPHVVETDVPRDCVPTANLRHFASVIGGFAPATIPSLGSGTLVL
jgi:hypothetical protein